MTNADTEITDELASSDSVDLNTPFVEPDVVSPALSEEGAAADDDEASAEDVGKSAALMSGPCDREPHHRLLPHVGSGVWHGHHDHCECVHHCK